MTSVDAVDLKAAEEGTASLKEVYKEPGDRVLDPSIIGKSLLERIPTPTGWRILILPYRGKGKTEGGMLRNTPYLHKLDTC